MQNIIIGTLVALLAWTPAGAQQGQQPPSPQPPNGTYNLGPGDALDIITWRNDELTMPVTVRPDGWISYPLVGELQVSGMTPAELQKALETALVKYVTSPMVTVVVTRIAGFKVSILGKVRQPGRYDVEGSATVLDVLALAGGPNDFANTADMYVLRRQGEAGSGYDHLPVRYSPNDADAVNTTNIAVKPGDIIIVP